MDRGEFWLSHEKEGMKLLGSECWLLIYGHSHF